MNRIFFFLLFTAITAAAQPKALFYMTTSPNSVKSFTDHADKIDILVPAWYGVDGNGLMWGGPNPFVLQTAAQHHVPVAEVIAGHLAIGGAIGPQAARPSRPRRMRRECHVRDDRPKGVSPQ